MEQSSEVASQRLPVWTNVYEKVNLRRASGLWRTTLWPARLHSNTHWFGSQPGCLKATQIRYFSLVWFGQAKLDLGLTSTLGVSRAERSPPECSFLPQRMDITRSNDGNHNPLDGFFIMQLQRGGGDTFNMTL